MSKRLIPVALTILSGTALAWAAACSSSSPTPDGGSSSSSSSSSSSGGGSSSGSGSGSGSGSSSGSSGGSKDSGGGGTFVKIDDMETLNADGGSTSGPIELTGYPTGESPGYWYDGVGPTDPRNTLTPPANAFAYSLLPAPHTTMPNVTSTHGAHVACALWPQYAYCQEALEFAQAPSDAGGSATVGVSYDISAYTGITFWVMAGANMTPGGVRVLFPDINSDPRGGHCAVGDAGACYDSWSYEIPATMVTTSWQQVTVTYAPMNGQLGVQNFGYEAANFDTKHVYGITFQVSGPSVMDASAAINADYWIDDIYFAK